MKLSEHNAAMQSYHAAKHELLEKAGVDCDKCGAEMVYPDNATLTSNPPKRRVQCPKCSHTGYKL